MHFWCSHVLAFRKKLELASHLLKYMSFVREMHMLHGDLVGRSEGEYFRWLRESVDLPWQKSVEDLMGR